MKVWIRGMEFEGSREDIEWAVSRFGFDHSPENFDRPACGAHSYEPPIEGFVSHPQVVSRVVKEVGRA